MIIIYVVYDGFSWMNTLTRKITQREGVCEKKNLIQSHSKHTLLWRYSVASNNKTYWGIHVKHPIFCVIESRLYIPDIITEDHNIKFRGNSSSGSRADTWKQTEIYDTANSALRDCTNAPKIMLLIENLTVGHKADSKINRGPGRKRQ
jgi:hypothetical protein